MFSRILVPVDVSDHNGPAIEITGQLLGASSGSALLLHVIEEIEDVPNEESELFYGEFRQRAEAVLADLGAEFEKLGVPAETQIRMGRRGSEIVRCAEEERCDLVVLRSHILDPEHPMRGIGSVSHQVSLAAGCAVLLIR
jgi:nucleotide-binding universal stress UspA family protein